MVILVFSFLLIYPASVDLENMLMMVIVLAYVTYPFALIIYAPRKFFRHIFSQHSFLSFRILLGFFLSAVIFKASFVFYDFYFKGYFAILFLIFNIFVIHILFFATRATYTRGNLLLKGVG